MVFSYIIFVVVCCFVVLMTVEVEEVELTIGQLTVVETVIKTVLSDKAYKKDIIKAST